VKLDEAYSWLPVAARVETSVLECRDAELFEAELVQVETKEDVEKVEGGGEDDDGGGGGDSARACTLRVWKAKLDEADRLLGEALAEKGYDMQNRYVTDRDNRLFSFLQKADGKSFLLLLLLLLLLGGSRGRRC
jgi:hypothetical protein